jgi:Right handed beta helix region
LSGNAGVDDPLCAVLDARSTDDDIRHSCDPLPGSPLLNAGSNAFVVGPTDVAGRPRVNGSAVDIGAAEPQQDLAECPEDSDKVLTRAVDPEGNDTGLIAGLPTHLTLQAAVDQALDGEVIGVFGRSTENVVISAAKRLTIIQCTVAQLTAAAAGPVVDLTSSEPITIIGLDTVGGTIGWRVGTDGHDLKGVRATGASQVGILVVGSHNSVSYNAVRSSAVGIRVEGTHNDLRGGTVECNGGDGVQLGPTATANTFRTATVQTNGGQGILVAGTSNTIRDNSRVNGNTLNGILVTGSQNSLRSNRADANTQDGFTI